MNLSSKINVNLIRVRHAGEQIQDSCPEGIVQICGDWPENSTVWTVSGNATDCRAFIIFLESKGLVATSVTLTRKNDYLTRLLWKADKAKDLSGTDYPDTMAGRAKINKAVCWAIAKIMATQLATERKVVFEHLEATCDIPATLEDLLCRARQQQLKQWQADIMTGQMDNGGEAAYLRSAPFPRFEGKYESDTRNRTKADSEKGVEATLTCTTNIKEQDAE